MATNFNDVLRESEGRATGAALRQMSLQQFLQNAIALTGSVQNITAPNINPDASGLQLRCDTVTIQDGLLSD